jgi:subtilisin family serine protease
VSRRPALSRLGRGITWVRQRRHIRRASAVTALSTALLVAVLGAAPLPPAADAADGANAAAAAAGPGNPDAGPTGVLPPGGRWSVTLLTGDVVDVRADADGRVTAAVRDRTGSFSTLRLPTGELYVIPAAARPLLDHVLDRELFDVTGLIRQHYDDRSIDVVPLIVERPRGVDARAALGLGRSAAEKPLPSIGAVAIAVPKSRTRATTGARIERQATADPAPSAADVLSGVDKVWLDRRMTATSGTSPSPAQPATQAPPLDHNLTQIGADDAWAAGLTGEGVRVGVLDTGIDGSHPDLAGQVVAEQNFSASEDTVDRVGHGTHVASLVAGTGAAASGARRGVAPDAELLSGKVLDDFGFGFESEVIAGMEWVAPQADVVNMSVGSLFPAPDRPLDAALDQLTEATGTLFVVAAGNSGPGSLSIETPGSAARALTVGAVDGDDVLADFSSRGPVDGRFELKPEVLAPGVDVVAARAAGTALGDPVDDTYTAASGTSMATPQVAGAAALLLAQHPDWSGDDAKATLIDSADPVEGDGYDVGAGRIAIDAAVTASVHAERDVVEATLPHPRTEAHTETLSWTNTGTAPRTLTFATELEDRDGTAVEDALSVTPAQLTLAPGATGTATLTIDGPALDDGLYSGTVDALVAETGDHLRTPVAVQAQAEIVDLALTATAPGGPPAPGVLPPTVFFTVVNVDDFAEYHFFGVFGGPYGDDHWTLPVPVGRYSILGEVSSSDPDSEAVAQTGDPDIVVDGDTSFVFDGAAAVPLAPKVSGVAVGPPVASSAVMVSFPDAGSDGVGLASYSWYPSPPVQVTPMAADADDFAAQQVYRLQKPHLTARVGGDGGDGGDELQLDGVNAPLDLPAGTQTLTAVDAGDGADLSAARGRLAVVRLPADGAERAAVTQRALDAGVGLLAFVDESRGHLTLTGFFPDRWAAVPTVAAGGDSATRLLAAGAAGEQVTLANVASPYVYDIVGEVTDAVDPRPVVTRRAQRDLARLDERFHRDAEARPDGVGVTGDRRYALDAGLMNLDSAGPIAERRTAYLTPDVPWQSMAIGLAVDPFFPEPFAAALSMDAGRTYDAGSRTTVRWLRRPVRPGPVGGPQGASFCQPLPVAREADTLHVWLAPFQDEPDRFGCAEPMAPTMTLERDGVVIGSTEAPFADFDLPAEAGTYRLAYEQEGLAPYDATSSTTWTFRSSAPTGDTGTPIPLLVVDYHLPLDTLNHPTSRTAELKVHQVTGTRNRAIRRLKAWTSTDDGATWRPAPTDPTGGRTWEVTLPRVAPGTGVSLKVDATDVAGNRIEQSLVDAYTG